MDQAVRKALIEHVARAVIANADELTRLDQAIGDGDHGLNMKRGFEAVLADIDGLSAKPLSEAITAVGTRLVMKVGGASGPLYGTLFMTLGKELPENATHGDVLRAYEAAIQAVKARGRSEAGQKTLLDVLEPVREELAAGGADLLSRLRSRAAQAAEATVPMKAVRGRAAFLGDRSIGHMDPGARSVALMVAAVCDALGG